MTAPNINLGGPPIPPGYVIGRLSPGTGQQELISLADIAQQVVSLGIVAAPGAASSLAQIATGTFLANLSGVTAAPTAHPFTDIVTLGTVTTGAWNATVITGQYGGTGVANTGKTLTLGGNLTTSGAFGTTVTVTNTTNSTLPAGTHTLAGLDVVQNWSANQSFNSGNFLLNGSTSGTLTIKPAAVAGTNTLTFPAGTTDFTATGGASQVVKQTSAGGAFTVGQLSQSDVSGTLDVAHGGVGQTSYTDGQLLIGNTAAGNTLSKATLTAGSNITITNGSGSITIAAATQAGSGLYAASLGTPPTQSGSGFSTWVNQGTATATDTTAGILITAPSNASAQNLRMLKKAVPGTDYTLTAYVALQPQDYSQFTSAFIGLYDGTKVWTLEISQRNSGASPLLYINRYTGVAGTVTADANSTITPIIHRRWLRIKKSTSGSGRIQFMHSEDGVNFREFVGFLPASYYFTPTDLVIGVSPFNTVTDGTFMSIALTAP